MNQDTDGKNLHNRPVPGSGIPALALEHVSYFYGQRQALDDVSFTLAPGRFAVLLGLNGAGKTTLFSLISHLFATRMGSIHIFGKDMNRHYTQGLSRIGIVFQARTLDLDLSIGQNLAYHASLHGIASGKARKRIDELLHIVGMETRLHDKARSLSGGQMRRIEIIRALLHQPSLLLLDEATVGLDINSRSMILSDIRNLVATSGISVLWATHLIDEVGKHDQIIMLHQGRLVANGTTAEVVKASRSADIHQAFASLTGFKPQHAGVQP